MKLDGEKQDSYFAVCWDCNHRSKPFDNTCKAFPKSVPLRILEGKNKHTKPLPGQGNDIIFEEEK